MRFQTGHPGKENNLMVPKNTLCRFLMLLSLGIFVVAAWGMAKQIEPFFTWFFAFAWWSYILFVESFLFERKGEAMLFSSPRGFLKLLPLSITVWLTFEAFNFRLQNWHYMNLPHNMGLRWLGYTLSFATVLPAVLSTKSLLGHVGLLKHTRLQPLSVSERFLEILVAIGILCLVLPLLFPRFFFPLVWLGFIPLLEPINYRSDTLSVLRDWENGLSRNLYLLLFAGLGCGFLWEFWNFWAGAKWVYSVPFFGTFRIFEMPLLGFLGFPPFAVECYVIVNASIALRTWARKTLSPDGYRRVRTFVVCAVVLFDVLVLAGIDRFTVVSFSG